LIEIDVDAVLEYLGTFLALSHQHKRSIASWKTAAPNHHFEEGAPKGRDHCVLGLRHTMDSIIETGRDSNFVREVQGRR
jgi:hypothetical protein